MVGGLGRAEPIFGRLATPATRGTGAGLGRSLERRRRRQGSGPESRMSAGKGADVAEKSPRKVTAKKSGKTLKEKRRDKKDKQQGRKGLSI